ncbi:MAG: WbqC family protein [Bacteroidetes bacterium]|nr:WbqC family protein [Bacteroidota bacterium]
MQPYFFPYIGYFQLINAVDEFIIYDKIEFTKKGWINRNRILVNGKDEYITLPLKKASDFLFVNDRYLADSWETEKNKLINKIKESYRKASYFKDVFPLIENCLHFKNKNLFDFILNTIKSINNYLEIKTPIIKVSDLPINKDLKAEKKVIEICKNRNATEYINPIGGVNIYNKETFFQNGIKLHFLKSNNINYSQLQNEFAPWLSIIDVMMFNSKKEIKEMLNQYDLI